MGHWGTCPPWSLWMHANFADLTPDGFYFSVTLSPRTSEPVHQAPMPPPWSKILATPLCMSLFYTFLLSVCDVTTTKSNKWRLSITEQIHAVLCCACNVWQQMMLTLSNNNNNNQASISPWGCNFWGVGTRTIYVICTTAVPSFLCMFAVTGRHLLIFWWWIYRCPSCTWCLSDEQSYRLL